jgi:hypothetical protein
VLLPLAVSSEVSRSTGIYPTIHMTSQRQQLSQETSQFNQWNTDNLLKSRTTHKKIRNHSGSHLQCIWEYVICMSIVLHMWTYSRTQNNRKYRKAVISESITRACQSISLLTGRKTVSSVRNKKNPSWKSIEQSSSWEASRSSADQQISLIL